MTTVEQILFEKGSDVIGAVPTTTAHEAARIMIEANVSCLVVEQRPDVLGIVTERDLVRRVLAAGKDPRQTLLAEVMSSPLRSCVPSDTAADCAKLMAAEHIRHLIVLDGGQLAGVLTLRDILGRGRA